MGVMSLKAGTKNWSEAKKDTNVQHSDSTKTNSAPELDKLGDQDIGSVLNKIADPNWVDPQKKMRSVGNNQLDKDAFMKLMLTQMKQQDPTNPLKSHEMAAQLATFTSLEQLQNMNSTLTGMKEAQGPQLNYQSLSFIGKTVSGDSSKVVRNVNDKVHDFKFKLPDDAKDVTVKVRDANGDIVKTYNLHDLKKGDNKIEWNGQNEQAQATAPGEYQFFIEATSNNDRKLAVQTAFEGTITGVNYTQEGPVLLIGNQSIKLSDVKKIIDPSIKSNDQNVKDVTSQDLKKSPQTSETNANQQVTKAPPTASAMTNNLEKQVAMSGGMIDSLKKQAGEAQR